MDSLPAGTPLAQETRGLARNASIISLGNVTSRLMGFVRSSVMARLFGSEADALALALIVPMQIYDLVTGQLVNSALVPAFSDYASADATEERRTELWQLASILMTLAALIISALVLGLMALAPQVIAFFGLIGNQTQPQVLAEATGLLRVTLPAVVFLSLSGILSALLYALKRFTLPAFVGAALNASMVLVSLLLAAQLGAAAMALGLLVGAVLQVALQLPGLGDGLSKLRPTLALAHPGLRRILKAYLPIIVSVLITQASIYIGLALAFGFTGGLSWMNYATTLYQFPLGLVGVAVSSAILPTLAAQIKRASPADYKATLVQGINLVLVLIIPATVGLFLLAEPIVALAFERGQFTAQDTAMTAQVLRWFLFGLSFAAVDLLLINAFYAQHDTWTPSSVGVLSVLVYVVIVLVFRAPLGLLSLMLADSVKQMTHAVVTGLLLSRRIGGFGHTGLWLALGKIGLAATVMGIAVAGAQAVTRLLPFPAGSAASLAQLLIPGLIGLSLYFFVAARLRIAEVSLALDAIRKRLRL